MMLWLEGEAAFDGGMPVVSVCPVGSPGERRGRLRALVASASGVGLDAVTVVHGPDERPRVVRPAGSRLVLSSASRHGLAALAVADRPIGVDVEAVEAAEPPWLALHPLEREALHDLAASALAESAARLWSLKEAYVKALGTGLSREPASFAVRFVGEGDAAIDDPCVRSALAWAETRFTACDGRIFAVSVVMLAD